VQTNPWLSIESPSRHQNWGLKAALGGAWRAPTYWPCGVRCRGGVTLIWALVGNLRTCWVMVREKAQVADPRGRKYRGAQSGADCFVVALKRGNARGAKGVGHPRPTAFGQLPAGRATQFGGRRQPSVGGTSRISREAYVRFCEGLGVKFPRPTRPACHSLIQSHRYCRPLSAKPRVTGLSRI